MSTMLTDLVGRHCSIQNEEAEYLTGSPDIPCRVLAADEEWIKIAYTDRSGRRITKLDRVETVDCVVVYEDIGVQ